jgi:hypothetical protein
MNLDKPISLLTGTDNEVVYLLLRILIKKRISSLKRTKYKSIHNTFVIIQLCYFGSKYENIIVHNVRSSSVLFLTCEKMTRQFRAKLVNIVIRAYLISSTDLSERGLNYYYYYYYYYHHHHHYYYYYYGGGWDYERSNNNIYTPAYRDPIFMQIVLCILWISPIK